MERKGRFRSIEKLLERDSPSNFFLFLTIKKIFNKQFYKGKGTLSKFRKIIYKNTVLRVSRLIFWIKLERSSRNERNLFTPKRVNFGRKKPFARRKEKKKSSRNTFGGSVSSRMKFSTISFRNEMRAVSSPPSLGDRAKYGKSALFQRGETHTCACFPRDERENKAFRRENATENGTFDVSSSFLCKTFPFLSFFSFFFFLLSYEHTTRRRFTFEFNNDINFCSLFFFLSFLFSFFLLFFSFNPFRCKRGKKFRLSSFPRLLPFSPAREGGRN